MAPLCFGKALAQPVAPGVRRGWGPLDTFISRTQRFAGAGCNNTLCLPLFKSITCQPTHLSTLVLLHLGMSPFWSAPT
jgi:hypothetical protein